MIPSDFGDVQGNFACLSDSEDDMKEYTPPSSQRKRKLAMREKFWGPAHIEEEVTYEFMSHKSHDKGNCDFCPGQRHEFMSSVSMQS
jgi:hypothetical protein